MNLAGGTISSEAIERSDLAGRNLSFSIGTSLVRR